MVLWLYGEYGTIVLAIVEAPIVEDATIFRLRYDVAKSGALSQVG